MLTDPVSSELIEHLCRHSHLTPQDASRLVGEVLAYYDETTASYIQRRHHELQKSGLANAAIYALIREEMTQHRFRAEDLSERQIRRTIYG